VDFVSYTGILNEQQELEKLEKRVVEFRSQIRGIIRKYIRSHYPNNEKANKCLRNLSIYLRGWTANFLGAAVQNNMLINLSMLMGNEHELEKLVMHEFIHMYLDERSHGEVFQNELKRLGFEAPFTGHNLPARFFFNHKCQKCGNEVGLFSPLPNLERECDVCGGDFIVNRRMRMVKV